MKRYFNSLGKSVWVVSAVFALASCNDWKDHYSYDSNYNGSELLTIAEFIESLPAEQTQDFIDVLSSTYMFNGDKLTLDTYWDLLGGDQFITVWVPDKSMVDADDWAKYKKEDKNLLENKRAGQEFIQNHIARFRHTVSAKTDEKIIMLSNKTFESKPGSIDGVSYKPGADMINIRCKNGIIHMLNGRLRYRPTIYEYLTRNSHDIKTENGALYDYRGILGNWFDKYTEEKIDEAKSVSSGINPQTGVMEYVDSVIIRKSILLDRFGDISCEDSTYALILPTPAVWNAEYDSVSKFFEYGPLENDPDSLQIFYTNYSMLSDMFFNMNPKVQLSKKDSIVSTTYDRNYNLRHKVRYNVYDQPYKSTGLIGSSIDSVKCSNGIIYICNYWPYEDSKTFNRVIKLEAEDYDDYDNTKITEKRGYINGFKGENLKNVYVARISSKDSKLDWSTEFKIRNNIKGRYALKLVVFPDTSARTRKPNLFSVQVEYLKEANWEVIVPSTVSIDEFPFYYNIDFENNPNKIDTILVCDTVYFPTSNYFRDGKNQPRVKLTVSSLASDQNNSGELWLDCIILEPVTE